MGPAHPDTKRKSFNKNRIRIASREILSDYIGDRKQETDIKTIASTPQSPTASSIIFANNLEMEQPKTSPMSPSQIKTPGRTKVWVGRILMVVIGMICAYIVLAISSGSNPSSWPWGFWYVIALGFDQLVFQPLSALVQFSLLYWYVSYPMHPKLLKFTKLLIGNDIMSVVDSKSKLIK